MEVIIRDIARWCRRWWRNIRTNSPPKTTKPWLECAASDDRLQTRGGVARKIDVAEEIGRLHAHV